MSVLEVFKISKDQNLLQYVHQKVWPVLKAVNYHYYFLIVNIVVELGR